MRAMLAVSGLLLMTGCAAAPPPEPRYDIDVLGTLEEVLQEVSDVTGVVVELRSAVGASSRDRRLLVFSVRGATRREVMQAVAGAMGMTWREFGGWDVTRVGGLMDVDEFADVIPEEPSEKE